MIRLGIILVVGAIVASMGVAMAFFMEYQPNILEAGPGEPLAVGPAEYTLTYEGVEEGNEEIRSDRTFMKVRIHSEDRGGGGAAAEKRQFTLLDRGGIQTPPSHGTFVEGSPGTIIAYFPLEGDELDEGFQYKVMVRPTKEQRSTDLGFVCVANCGG